MPTTRTLSRWTLVATVTLVALGGFTRGSGSGYGCADRWPLCEGGVLGGLLPRWEYHMVIEWSHRWLAVVVGLLIVALLIAAWRESRRRTVLVAGASTALAVVTVQAWLGRMVVKGDLDRDLVMVHLAVSFLLVAVLVLLVVATRSPRQEMVPSAARAWTAGLLAMLAYGAMLLGSSVHNQFFEGWPLVSGRVFPEFVDRQVALHWAHRLTAGAGWAMVSVAAWRAGRRGLPERHWLTTGAVAFTGNVALGGAHVVTEVTSAAIVSAHILLAAIAWAALVGATVIAAGWATRPVEA